MKSWGSHSVSERKAMKRLKIEPELRDRDARHKDISFGALFEHFASILTEIGSWEEKTHFLASLFVRERLLWLIRSHLNSIPSILQCISITLERYVPMRAFKSSAITWFGIPFWSFSLYFVSILKFFFRSFHNKIHLLDDVILNEAWFHLSYNVDHFETPMRAQNKRVPFWSFYLSILNLFYFLFHKFHFDDVILMKWSLIERTSSDASKNEW